MTQAPRRIDQPEPGFFRLRLVRKGPWVGARIYKLSLTQTLVAEINGEPADIWRVWNYAEQIEEADYEWLMAYPPSEPMQPQHISTRGINDAMREESERLALYRRPIG